MKNAVRRSLYGAGYLLVLSMITADQATAGGEQSDAPKGSGRQRSVSRHTPTPSIDTTAGRLIYLTGQSPSRKAITARPGGASYESPALLWRCVTCHAQDGRGNPAGFPSGWTSLAHLFEPATINHRSRPPYDDATLARAITQGIDSGGNQLSGAMPRYRMSAEDLASLVAYVRTLSDLPGAKSQTKKGSFNE